MWMAAFSQRMPPVQNDTTVLPSSSALWAATAWRKIAEFRNVVFHRVLEGTHGHLEGIACIEHHHGAAGVVVALVEPALEIHGPHGRRPARFGADQRHLHRDDFLGAHQHPLEGLGVRQALLGRDIREARVGVEPGHEGVDGVARAGQEHVDALGRQQDRALEVGRLAARAHFRTQGLDVVQRDEFVSGNIDDLHGMGAADHARRATR